jgi:hypothetical protein
MPGRNVDSRTLQSYLKDPVEIAVLRFRLIPKTLKSAVDAAIIKLLGQTYPRSLRSTHSAQNLIPFPSHGTA